MNLLIVVALVFIAYQVGKANGYNKRKTEGCKHVIVVKEKKG